MWESIRNAWVGWQSFTDGGKLAAPTMAAIVYLIMRNGRTGPACRLARYGGMAAALCICPVTAALLMHYQTSFYDYPWIWSIVPMTALTALGGSVFLTDQWKKGGWSALLYNAVLTLVCAGVLILCGGLGENPVDAAAQRRERLQAEAVLTETRAVCGEEFCLWAPREILEYARTQDGGISLLYGRDMWDAALHAYSYDVYSAEEETLYLWIEHLRDYGAEGFGTEDSSAEGRECVRRAFALGADAILLPMDVPGLDGTAGNPESSELQALSFGEDVEIIRLETYFLLKMR